MLKEVFDFGECCQNMKYKVSLIINYYYCHTSSHYLQSQLSSRSEKLRRFAEITSLQIEHLRKLLCPFLIRVSVCI